MFYNKAFYRIITERKEDYQIEKILDSYFESYTMYAARGVYKGEKEDSLIIEIISEDYQAIISVCHKIKIINNQESVMLQKIKSEVIEI